MARAVQRIFRHGSSACLTIPRAILYKLDLIFGDHVVLEELGDGTLLLRKFREEKLSRSSPGMVQEPPAGAPPR